MADVADYTQMWGGVFAPPRVGDEDRGVILLDDEAPGGRDDKSFKRNEHARGLTSHESFKDRRAFARFASEGLAASPRGLYVQGSRRLGHPGFRGMVTSSREGRPAIDSVVWDDRPPHFAASSPNEHAHLYVNPEARGPALFQKKPAYAWPADAFRGGPAGFEGLPVRDALEVTKAVVFVIIAVLVAMWLMVSSAEKRLKQELECALQAVLTASRESARAAA